MVSKLIHATDFFLGAKAFKRDTQAKTSLFEDHSRRIPRVVGEHVVRILLVAFRPEEYEKNRLTRLETKVRYECTFNGCSGVFA
jgi:hypothetical protein